MKFQRDLPEIAAKLGADLVLIGGKVITVDDLDSIAQAVAIKYGRIAFVGSSEEAEQYIMPNTKVIEIGDGCATPGFITTHEHFLRYGYNAVSGIDLWYPRVKSIKDIVKAVEAKVAKTPKGDWVFGFGWDENLLTDKRAPNRYDLDPVSPDNPVYLGRVYQMVTANTLALELAGVTKDSTDPEYGKIFRDQSKEPTGLFHTILPSANPFISVLPTATTEMKEKAIVQACYDYNSEGMTSVIDATVGKVEPNDLVAYQNVRMRNELTMRVYALYGFIRTVEEAKETVDRYTTYGDDIFKLGGIKLSLDGGVVPKTGYFYEPYLGEPDNFGRTKWTKEELMEAIEILHNAGWQCCTHTIGDKAIDWALDCYENAMTKNPRPDPRHQIIHIYYPTEEAINRVQKLKIMANVQSTFIHFEGDIYIKNLGSKRGECVKPLKTFVKKGIPIGNSQDYPSGPIPANLGLWSAVSRETFSGEVLCPKQRLTVQEALRTYTLWAAKHIFMEDRLGSIEVGKYADIVIWDKDIYTIPTDYLRAVKAKKTIMNGKIVYDVNENTTKECKTSHNLT
jgi:predicted amidohydrolase YtcJ